MAPITKKARTRRFRTSTGRNTVPEGIAIVPLKEGGVGWKLKGKDRKPSFGRVFVPEDAQEASKRALSDKVLDQVLREASALKAKPHPGLRARVSMAEVKVRRDAAKTSKRHVLRSLEDSE